MELILPARADDYDFSAHKYRMFALLDETMFMGANLSLMYQFLVPHISEWKPQFALAGNVSAAVLS